MESSQRIACERGVKVARWVFALAGLYGLIVMVGMLVKTPAMISKAPQQQPEMYYGFVTLCLGWQGVFILIATDPMRYRPLMWIAAIFEKFAFVAALVVLLIQRRAGLHWIPPGTIDLGLGIAFLISYAMTKLRRSPG